MVGHNADHERRRAVRVKRTGKRPYAANIKRRLAAAPRVVMYVRACGRDWRI